MPRNGSGIYSIPPGTEGFPDTTIESAKYNTYVHDVETDLNLPRPIVAGGTGATTADGALAELGAEKSSAEVTNYDSHVWIPGSFYSAGSATGGPVAGRPFVGIVVSSDPPQDPPLNQNVVVHARDQNDSIIPGRLYVREKKAGTWGPWKPDGLSLYTSDTPPAGAPDNSFWWESDTGLLYLRYDDGAGVSQWVIACPQPDISTFAMKVEIPGIVDESAVRYDAPQSLTSAQQLQARQNIYAAPFDAMAYSGMQINGGMEVSQENGAAGVSTNGAYICDGWLMGETSAATMSANASVSTSIVPGFYSYINFFPTVAGPATPAAGDNVYLIHRIEGYRISRLAWGTANAQPITISFWTKHIRTGLYSVSVRNSTNSRSYVATYTQDVSDVIEYKTVTIPGDTGTLWQGTNTIGMSIGFAMATGTTQTAPAANTWYETTGAGYTAAPGQVNAVQLTSDRFRLTGVTVLPGTQAPTAAQSPNVIRPYGEELVTCQRYYRKYNPAGGVPTPFGGVITSATQAHVIGSLSPTMRSAPTLSINGMQLSDVYSANFNLTGLTSSTTADTAALICTVTGGMTVGRYARLQTINAGDYVSFDARL